VSVFLDAYPQDFDDFTDSYVLSSPDGDFSLAVDVDSPNGSSGLLFPNLDDAIRALAGQWTISGAIIGIPFDPHTFNVTVQDLSEDDLPFAEIEFPADMQEGIPARPIVRFSGPSGAGSLRIGYSSVNTVYPNDGVSSLPVTTKQHTPDFDLEEGENSVYVSYDLELSQPKLEIGNPSGLSWRGFYSQGAIGRSHFSVGGGDPGIELVLTGPELAQGQLVWSFPTRPGKTYEVQERADIVAGEWQVRETVAGDGARKSFSISPDRTAGFFRVLER